ncbi:MAG: class I SAM-dependent methyltransferase [Terriglobia bacterium]
MTSNPAPTPLQTILFELLRQSGPITFEQYMSLCLYHPLHGYYMQGRERTGLRGDYFTSPDLHPIFARLIARQAAEMWERLDRPSQFTWVEMGAGRGWFARDFLQWIATPRPDFAAALDYVAIEPGLTQQARIAGRLADGGFAGHVRLIANLEELAPSIAARTWDPTMSGSSTRLAPTITGCFFSNELIDSFPVSIVTRSKGRLREIYVSLEGEALRETTGPISDPAVAAAVARYAKELDEGQRVEVNLHATRWMQSVAEKLNRGFVLTIDYGDLASRLYTPDRPRGTIMAYRGHIASDDALATPGEQDLTAHVNFSALIDAGKAAGLDCLGFTTQERFLMALGESTAFGDLYDPGQTALQQLDARLKLKRLIHPEGMGAIFKVLIQYRGPRGLSSLELAGLSRTVAGSR